MHISGPFEDCKNLLTQQFLDLKDFFDLLSTEKLQIRTKREDCIHPYRTLRSFDDKHILSNRNFTKNLNNVNWQREVASLRT